MGACCRSSADPALTKPCRSARPCRHLLRRPAWSQARRTKPRLASGEAAMTTQNPSSCQRPGSRRLQGGGSLAWARTRCRACEKQVSIFQGLTQNLGSEIGKSKPWDRLVEAADKVDIRELRRTHALMGAARAIKFRVSDGARPFTPL